MTWVFKYIIIRTENIKYVIWVLEKSVTATVIYFIFENKDQFPLLITGSQIYALYFDYNI